MTVATTNITSGPYTGTGSGSTFSYDFRIDDESQLSVWESDDAIPPVKTLLAEGTDYTVAGVGVDGGGIITRVAGNLPTDYIWYIRSNYADTQDTAFASQGGFLPSVHEDALDKRTFVSQQQEDRFRRALKIDDSDESAETADLTIPIVATRASQYLGFDANGDLITIAGTAGAITVSSFMETLLDDNNIETALGTLGLSKGSDVASAGTLALGVGRYFDVTGTTPILAIGTKFIGAISILHFTGSLVFTHHATNLINIGGADITTEAGDHAVMVEYDTGKSVMINYTRASSLPMILDTAQTVTGVKTFSAPPVLQGSAWPSFSVYRNTDQTVNLSATIQFDTEVFDTNDDFDSYRFTPTVAGKYLLTANVTVSDLVDAKYFQLAIEKNGNPVGITYTHASFTEIIGCTISVVVDANGSSDYFEVVVDEFITGTITVVGSANGHTTFSGSRIA